MGIIKFISEVIEIIRLAIILYKKTNYEVSKQKILKAIKEEDDTQTAEVINDIIHHNDK